MRERLAGGLVRLLVVVGLVVVALSAGAPDVAVYDDSTVSLTLDGGPFLAWSTGRTVRAALVVLGLWVLAALGGWLFARRGAPGGSGAHGPV